jgi:DNA-binding MarR family transcriptional regulator
MTRQSSLSPAREARIADLFLVVAKLIRSKAFEERQASIAHLLCLRVIGERKNPTMQDLARGLAVKGPTATALIDALAAEGFVARVQEQEDRRVTRVRLTRRGAQEVARQQRLLAAAVRTLLAPLTTQEKISFEETLTKIKQGT